ncbi:DUF4157 domain-containing protein [Streptomyces massasporeus]|uniref:eCIS core domain-containing protein n=1 Tax=Streptomyces massasporeus TaxID=67324 RepID=UPI00380A0F90
MSNSHAQDGRSEQTAEQRRRKRKERAARSRAPEPRDIVSGAGQPLDPGVRRELEERLGHDLSRVRLHTGQDAGRLADLLGADAVAVGQDILFREGAYRPGTDEGRRLLAHELLHTVQNPHGLGALRAGRDLGAVSLPQQAIEREAETTAQDLVRDTGTGAAEAAPDVEEGQATPGWLRYATADADRRRMEQLDPATLVDRIANGLLRSLRGDPEDRSGRVRVQLARMAPEVQDSVLDRLEVRLPGPVVDRLLEGVEETERLNPLPTDATIAPEAVPGAAEEILEDRTREDSGPEADGAGGRDGQRNDTGGPGGRRQDGTAPPDGRRDEHGEGEDGSASGEAGQQNAQGGAGSAARRQEGAQDEQERSQDQQEEKDASGRDGRTDADDARKAASDTDREQRDQDKQDERAAEEERPEDEAAQEPDRQGGEEERRADEGTAEAARRQAPAPGTVDRSGAEPGEKSRTGGHPGTARSVGDPENEQDADDEPLGLDAGFEQDDGERSTEEETKSGTDADADTDPTGPESTDDAKLFTRRRRGGPPPPALSDSDGQAGPELARDTAAADASRDASPHIAEDEAEDRALRDLGDDLDTDHDSGAEETGPLRTDASSDPLRSGSFEPATGKDGQRQRAAEQREDAEAARRDEDAWADAGAASGTAPAPGASAGPEPLAKADEDARAQGAGSPTGPGSTPGGPGQAQSSKKTEAGASDRTGGKEGTSGAEQEGTSGAEKGTDKSAGKPEVDTSGRSDTAGDGDAKVPAPDTSPGDQGVTEGKGPATTPGPDSGSDKVSTPGPAGAPQLAPGHGPSPMTAGPEPKTNTPKADAPGSRGASGGGPATSRSRPAGSKRQAARKAAQTASRRGGGGGRTSSASAPVRSGGRPSGSGGSKASPKAKKEAPAPDVSNATPESGLSTAAGLKPHQALETLKGVDSAVGRSVDKERTSLRKAPPRMQRPSGSPRTVPGGPEAAAPGTYTNAKVARTDAAQGKTPEIKGEQKPQGEVPGANVPEPSWWDIAVTIGAQLFGKLLKEILPLDDLIDSILGLPTKDEGLRNARVGDAPRLPLENDSDPQRTDEQGRKLDERKDELHRSGREDAARPMGEDQIYPDVPKETLTGKVAGGKKGTKGGGTRSVSGGGVPIESASAVAEHDRGPQIQAGFSQGRQKMGQERQTKDKKAADDRKQHDQDLQKEVTASGKKQSDARDKGRSDIADSRDRWRKEQDDKVSEIDDKKGKKYDKVRDDIKKKEEDTDKDVDKRTEDDNKKIDDEQTGAEKEAEKKQEDGKDDADNWLEEAIEKLKEFFENLKNAIKSVFEKARQVVTDLIDKFKQQVFKLIDDARNWVIDQINTFADALIALGDELLADYPAMRDKWRNTIDGARDWAVQKVNEAADALKEVAGKLLDGLCGALLAGLDALEGGLLAAVDIAETVTVGALEFGAAAVAALGEWAAIFNDIVSDPGDWISKAGAAAETGAKEHLFEEIKTAVRAWFNQKVQEIIGVPMEDFQELISGGVSVEQMAQMAWDEALPQLPVIIGVMVVEKVVAKLIPGAGWVMAVIDALQTAWGALSEILAAFGLFMDFLKSVKSGNGALPFAKAVAAGVVALLELIYEFLVEGVSRFMGKVAERLGTMLKNLRNKKHKPGSSDDEPDAPDKPKDERPAPTDDRTPSPDHPAAKPGPRPTSPRKPSPDKTSRPPSGPRPGKRSTPEKKSRPAHTTRPKKRRDDDERRDEGREVNAARRRMRDADRRMKDDDKDERPGAPSRRGPARDTLRSDRRRGPDDRDRDPKDTRPADRRTDDPGRDGDRRTDRRGDDERRRDEDRPGNRRRDDGRRGTDKDRTRRRPLRRARQTVKSAANRARRAARKLFGKTRRRVGGRLNDRLRRLRELWRRRRDRLRDERSRRTRRDRTDKRDQDHSDITLPKVRYADADDGEQHTLTFHGRGSRAPLYIHSTPAEVPPFLQDWERDLDRPEARPHKAEQKGFLDTAWKRYADVKVVQDRELTATEEKARSKEKRDKERDLKREMRKFADQVRNRVYYDIPDADLQDFSNVTGVKDVDTRPSEEHVSRYIGNPTKTLFGGGGQDARKAPDGQPPGWDDIADRGLSAKGAWVRMHLLPESLGGKATGNNLVPARGETNKTFYRELEGPAYHDIPVPEPIIWYRTRAEFHPGLPHVASHIHSAYGRYEKVGGTGRKQSDWREIETAKDEITRNPLPVADDERNKLSINGAGRPSIQKRLLDGKHEALAKHFVDARRELHEDEESISGIEDVKALMRAYKSSNPTLKLTGREILLANLRKKSEEINWDWEF